MEPFLGLELRKHTKNEKEASLELTRSRRAVGFWYLKSRSRESERKRRDSKNPYLKRKMGVNGFNNFPFEHKLEYFKRD